MVLTYGGEFRFVNGWNDWGGGYLDGNPGTSTVYTGRYARQLDPARDGTTSVWRVEPVTGKKTGPVLTNDVVYLHSRGAGYLATAGRGCNDNLYCTSLPLSEPGVTGQWRFRITKDSDEAVEIGEGVGFHLQNARDDWGGGYLATRGYHEGMNYQGNVPLLLAVSTGEDWDGGDPLGHLWRFPA